eukprot:GCRY01004392.1.p1 GENE.GCRY01004392.1~~GCRY01004392.1.p1  ORF type:complete len:239 (-),score=48.15 GCRY01004392.1:1345-2061(-)
MAENTEKQNTESQDKSVEVAVRKKKQFNYYPAVDIVILKEVIAINPYAAVHGKVADSWNEVASHSGFMVSGESVKKRVTLLLNSRKKEEMVNLKSSGTEEEYQEREQLLDEILELEKLGKETTESKKKKTEEQNRQGEAIRNAALTSLGEDKNEPPKKKRKSDKDSLLKAYLEVNASKIEIEQKRIEFEQQQLQAEKVKNDREFELQKEKMKMEREQNERNQKFMQDLLLMLTQKGSN